MYVLAGAERDVIFTGDAAKNRAELTCGRADLRLRCVGEQPIDRRDLDNLAQAARQHAGAGP